MGIPRDSTLKIPSRSSMCFYDKKHDVILFSVLSHNRGEKSFWMVSCPPSWISTTSSGTPVSHSSCFCASLEAVLRYFFSALLFLFAPLLPPPLFLFFFFRSQTWFSPALLTLPSSIITPPFRTERWAPGWRGWVVVGRMKKWAFPVNHADWMRPLCEDATL